MFFYHGMAFVQPLACVDNRITVNLSPCDIHIWINNDAFILQIGYHASFGMRGNILIWYVQESFFCMIPNLASRHQAFLPTAWSTSNRSKDQHGWISFLLTCKRWKPTLCYASWCCAICINEPRYNDMVSIGSLSSNKRDTVMKSTWATNMYNGIIIHVACHNKITSVVIFYKLSIYFFIFESLPRVYSDLVRHWCSWWLILTKLLLFCKSVIMAMLR